jgi:pimeloyl-ACP methyl ester carboxylesterase
VYPTPAFDGLVRERRELRFESGGEILAGELDLPLAANPPLVFIVHHSGPVSRGAYGYLAEILTRAGYAVMRFDKRGTGLSGGVYGCCEADDALAAYGAVMNEAGFDRCNVFVVAQSIGTQHVAERFAEFARLQQPRGVALLSNLLGPDRIAAITAPIHIIVSDSEPNVNVISKDAVQAHRAAFSFGATDYIAVGSEHSLFDISAGPMDWRDPLWVTRYHRGAMQSLVDWLNAQHTREITCPPGRAG